jgi:putative zinc finger/helix-turn-helix YgiT family protein
MDKCVMCGELGTLEAAREQLPQTVAGIEFRAELAIERCTACGERYYALNDLAAMELAIAVELAALGVCTPESFKYIRKTLGFRASDVAELLDVTDQTVSRWERGATTVDHTAFAVLAALASDRRKGSTEMLDRLAAVRAPKQPRKPVIVSAA